MHGNALPRLTPAFAAGQVAAWTGALLAPDQRIALVAIAPDGRVIERMRDAGGLTEDGVLRWLRHLNARGFGIHATPNPLGPDACDRTKAAFPSACTLYADVDHDVPAVVRRISDRLPVPTLVVQTSPGRLQLIWRLTEALAPARAEAILRSMARRFGSDPAATDVSRVLRLPGFVNTKYGGPVGPRIVRVLSQGAPVSPGPFLELGTQAVPRVERPSAAIPSPLPVSDRHPPTELGRDEDLRRAWGGANPRHWVRPATASERDLYLAQRLTERGVDAGRIAQILACSPNRAAGRPKSNLEDYLARTIARARVRTTSGRRDPFSLHTFATCATDPGGPARGSPQ